MTGPEASSPANDAPAHIPCIEVVELLTDYLEGALDPVMQRRVEAHLDLCPPCVDFLEQLRSTIASVEQLPVETLPTETVDALEQAFRSFHQSDRH
jgi:predicted anti-sigma-YlaC factor YlaD